MPPCNQTKWSGCLTRFQEETAPTSPFHLSDGPRKRKRSGADGGFDEVEHSGSVSAIGQRAGNDGKGGIEGERAMGGNEGEEGPHVAPFGLMVTSTGP